MSTRRLQRRSTDRARSPTLLAQRVTCDAAKRSNTTTVPCSWMPSSGNLEKARGKVALGAGYSLMAWMRLSKNADLTGGVGLVDEDEEESTWKQWSLAEVSEHNTAEDAWMVLRGKVVSRALQRRTAS